jgi:hypothetical protein
MAYKRVMDSNDNGRSPFSLFCLERQKSREQDLKCHIGYVIAKLAGYRVVHIYQTLVQSSASRTPDSAKNSGNH